MNGVENRRLLIVDDEEEIRKGYAETLNYRPIQGIISSRMVSTVSPLLVPGPNSGATYLNIETHFAASGDEALALLLEDLAQGRHFAGALVDVRMPGKLDGIKFVQEAWKHDPDLLVSLVTAHQDRSVDEISKEFGTLFEDQWDYLTKPFTVGEIRQKARYLISSWNRRNREKQYLKTIQEQQEILVNQERLAAVGRLTRSIGHEFGNILQPVLTKLDLLQLQIRDDKYEGLDDSISEIIEAITLGAHVCQDLLTFSRENSPDPTGAAKEGIARSSVLISATVQKALRLLRHEMKRRDIRVEMNIPENLTLIVNEPKLIQILINLCKNAMDAMQEKGVIRIRAEQDGNKSLRIEISDTGSGISPQNLSKMFQPLFSTKGRSGNGLGLSTCQQIMQENQGTISIQSQENQGTVVTLLFSDPLRVSG